MRTVKIEIFLLLLVFAKMELVEKCPGSSFTKLTVIVQEANISTIQTARQCLSPQTLSYGNDLKRLKITDQYIPVLKKGFVCNISSAFILQVTRSDITIIEEGAFLNLVQVTEIDLGHNQIEWIESNTFTNMALIDAIDLCYNKLEFIFQNTFSDLPSLVMVDLSHNKLKSFQQEIFYKTPNLEVISLSNNEIESIPRAAFINLSNLTLLDLDHNHISHINKNAFEGMKLLKILRLDFNWMKNINVDFRTTPNLSTLLLNGNNFTYVSDDFLSGLEDCLHKLWIHGNPWQCSCFDKIMKWGFRTNILISWQCNSTELYCIVPRRNLDKCTQLNDEDFYTGSFMAFQQTCKEIEATIT